MARILKTDGALHDLKGTDPKGRLTLKQMQQAVGGDVHVVKLSGDKMQMVILLDVDSSLKPVRINHVATEMYRVPSSVRPLLSDGGAADKDRLYSAEEMYAALEEYAKANRLTMDGGARARSCHVLYSSVSD